MPLWKEALLFVAIVVAVAGSVTFMAVRLQQTSEAIAGTSATNPGRWEEARDLPDVQGSLCSDQASKRP